MITQVGQNIPFCVFSHRPSRATLATTVIKGIDRSIEWHRPLKITSTVYDPEIRGGESPEECLFGENWAKISWR